MDDLLLLTLISECFIARAFCIYLLFICLLVLVMLGYITHGLSHSRQDLYFLAMTFVSECIFELISENLTVEVRSWTNQRPPTELS